MRSPIRLMSLAIGLACLCAAFLLLGPGPERAHSAGDVDCSDFANRPPPDWDPIVRSIWVCALYGVPALLAAGLVFLRWDVAES